MDENLAASPLASLEKDCGDAAAAQAAHGRHRASARLQRGHRGESAPCHVSFLAPDVNVEMQNFLGPLLPVARFLSIPVLDFDKYGLLFDAERTAETCVPAATSFLRQYVIRG